MPFSRDGEEFVYTLESEIYRANRLAFCFDAEDGTLIKHGDEDRVSEYARTMRTTFVRSGNADFGASLTVVSSSEWDVDLVNRFVDCTGSILSWWNKQPAEA